MKGVTFLSLCRNADEAFTASSAVDGIDETLALVTLS
jgi:hypothetical protein